MMESSQEKKKMFYMIVLVLTLIAMIIGATLAYFSFIGSQKNEGTVYYTGTLEVNYIDGVYIRNPILYPIKNVNYNTYDKVYRNNFAVKSSGTLDQNLQIDLNISKNEFLDNALKYAIYNEKGYEIGNGYVPRETGTVTLADNIYLASNDTARYTLIIWLDNTNYNQNEEMGHIITGSISIHAVQIKY